MRDSRMIGAIALVCAVALAGGCKRGQASAPEVQTTAGVQTQSHPVTVLGCLRSGELADNSWALTADPLTADGTTVTPATYQLTGGDAAMLRENVGHQVEVSGTVNAEQEVASSSEAVARRAKGTSGTPTVETKTDLEIKRLVVSSIKPTGNRCK